MEAAALAERAERAADLADRRARDADRISRWMLAQSPLSGAPPTHSPRPAWSRSRRRR